MGGGFFQKIKKAQNKCYSVCGSDINNGSKYYSNSDSDADSDDDETKDNDRL